MRALVSCLAVVALGLVLSSACGKHPRESGPTLNESAGNPVIVDGPVADSVVVQNATCRRLRGFLNWWHSKGWGWEPSDREKPGPLEWIKRENNRHPVQVDQYQNRYLALPSLEYLPGRFGETDDLEDECGDSDEKLDSLRVFLIGPDETTMCSEAWPEITSYSAPDYEGYPNGLGVYCWMMKHQEAPWHELPDYQMDPIPLVPGEIINLNKLLKWFWGDPPYQNNGGWHWIHDHSEGTPGDDPPPPPEPLG